MKFFILFFEGFIYVKAIRESDIVILKKVKLSNFRCFGETETEISFQQLTAFIGTNSTGKTAAMIALTKLFGNTTAEREIYRADFHLPYGELAESLKSSSLYIEAVFGFDELSESDNPKNAIPSFFKYFVVDGPGEMPYMRIRLEATYTEDGSSEGVIETKCFFIRASEKDKLSDSVKTEASRSVLSNIKCIYVPALRNPSEQLKNASGTILYRLLSRIKWEEATRRTLQEHIDGINTTVQEVPAVNDIGLILQKQWAKYHDDQRYANTHISLNTSDIETLLKNTEIKFAPTEIPRDYDVCELGDGLRSLFYFSLVNTLLETEAIVLEKYRAGAIESSQTLIMPPILTIVAVEEPENHIAPQLLGKVILNLKETSTHNNAQVVLSSHSASIVKRVDATAIRYFRLSESKTSIVNTIRLPDKSDERYKYVKGAVEAYPEIYFSHMVILGEGDSEELVLPKIIEASCADIDIMGISVAPLGGRHVNYFWSLLRQLEIPYITLLDLDKERYGGGWGRIKYAISQLLKLGYDKNLLLKKADETILSAEDLENMHDWDVNAQDMNFWISKLETYDIYFSKPLDLDFLLLEHYSDSYKNTVEEGMGPRISGVARIVDLEKKDRTAEESQKYNERVANDIKAVLKKEGGTGETYTDPQKELMVWYNYLFLNRSKPATHLATLNFCDFSGTPDPLNKIVTKIRRGCGGRL